MARQPKELDQVNIKVGRRLRLKRELAGLSQAILGQAIGVSRIKIGQYESGQSAIPASHLFKLSQYFKIDVCYFFSVEEQPTPVSDLEEIDPMLNKLSISLLRDFNALDNPEVRRTFAAVMERISQLNQQGKQSPRG
ncbi:helix-turn-helix domain-containing protein [Terasakiella sp. SH-1]|uniref:helix-turn-helix domain-containing protein n=1 Tax=Terasakiella sp. SH-1 TaxID=2560057 RepID=UPI0010731EAF|nr:helix-turn-helix domain-containing protein [Terasakiella sp. SH-1]